MRKFVATFTFLVMGLAFAPGSAGVLHDTPRMVPGVALEAADIWWFARALSEEALGPGCLTESVQTPNTCGGGSDTHD